MWTPENRPKYDRSKLRYPSDLTDREPYPHCDEADHSAPCATLNAWWLGLSLAEQERFIAEGLADV